ncbi:hypothetical protein [Pedobacter sp. Hv1]|uniref:hypothetical protein n=1 Tax=Pedobacter sp. Hv1 TaxID=1740090 RepID=UPI00128F7FD9|nr:hypothetical protein [Pedobacter sp. Hv1]
MKNILFPVLLCLLSLNSTAQQSKKNSIYLELLGNSVIYSVNYDRIIPLSAQLKLVPRIGFMYAPLSTSEHFKGHNNISIPIEVNLLWAKRTESKNFAEAGIGLSLIGLKEYKTSNLERVSTNRFGQVLTARLGFRHQKPTGGFMYRAGLLIKIKQDERSLATISDDYFIKLYPGFSLGYTF